jgi:hypothetical protein
LAPTGGLLRAAKTEIVVWVHANGEVNIAPGSALVRALGWQPRDRIAIDWRASDGCLRLRRSATGFLLQRPARTKATAALRLRVRSLPGTPRRPVRPVAVGATVLPGEIIQFVPPWTEIAGLGYQQNRR